VQPAQLDLKGSQLLFKAPTLITQHLSLELVEHQEQLVTAG
jgi:hypothetical protein